jgi:hypothetical protein
MKISNKPLEELLHKAAADTSLKLEELRVLMVWITDSAEYSACVSILQKRLPQMNEHNIRRALRKLNDKGYIYEDGYGTFINDFGKCQRYKKYSLSNRSPETPIDRSGETPMNRSPETLSIESNRSPESSIPSKRNLLTLPSKAQDKPAREVGEDRVLSKEGIAAKASIPTKEQWDTKEKIRNRQDKTWMIRPYPYV